jgi:hypothetical protein
VNFTADLPLALVRWPRTERKTAPVAGCSPGSARRNLRGRRVRRAHRHLFLLGDVDRLSAVGEQLVGAVQRSVGRRILGVVFGLAVPPDVFMCVVTGHREDVLPCVHARHPAGRHADGQIETRGHSTAPACPESPPGRRRRAAARGWGYSLGRTTDVCAQRPTVTEDDGDRCRCGRGVRGDVGRSVSRLCAWGTEAS